MSSTIEITKACEWCGSTFTARKCTTRYCCKRCAEHAYKDAKRKEHVEQEQAKASSPRISDDKRLFITPVQCARLLGVCRASIYNYLAANSIPCYQFKGKTLISRESLNALFNWIDTDITLFSKRLDMWKLGGNFAAENLTDYEKGCNILPCFYNRAGLYFTDC